MRAPVTSASNGQRVALVTGVGRRAGIGAALATRLAADGWDVALTYWRAYDERMPWPSTPDEPAAIAREIAATGRRALAVEADLARVETPAEVFAHVEDHIGAVTALVMSHAESVDSDLRSTTVESFDRHMAVNARASWLLVREFATRFRGPHGAGRIVALTSDHTAGNLPYGASKGALDRIVLAAAIELADLGVTANVVDPGRTTPAGWTAPCATGSPVARPSAGSAPRWTPPPSCRSCARRRAAGSTVS